MANLNHWTRSLLFTIGVLAGFGGVAIWHGATRANAASSRYIILAWNDLGMHCYNRDFSNLAVLPPYNNLWAQVVQVSDPPRVITDSITVTYVFTDNTYSAGKSNFWQYAQQLFGLSSPLTPNVGLKGKGLAGTLDPVGDHFVAEGIPLTEFRDSAPTTPYPYQTATLIARDSVTGIELARTTVVAPVSTEMHCDTCHSDNGRGNEGVATGVVETNILTAHDREEGTHLMSARPVLCASCHASNALGTPGKPGVPNLSNAMHDQHTGEVPDTINGCYNCHPGPQTLCLRDVMSQKFGMTCIACHGNMQHVAQNATPWLNEPRCDTCHNSGQFQQNQALYRHSTQHGGIYCEACHDSTHAIAPSREPNDAIKFITLQGHGGPVDTCTVCHLTTPTGPGPHGLNPPQIAFSFTADQTGVTRPGSQATYQHGLHNTGTVTDTYSLAATSTQGWSTFAISASGVPVTSPVRLGPGQTAIVTVVVTVPAGPLAPGLSDTTVITTTSGASLALVYHVTDTTRVAQATVFLPLMARP